MLQRLGRSAARHHWRFVVGWFIIALAIVTWSQAEGGKERDDFTIPGSESQAALDLLEQDFPNIAGATATVVFHARTGTLETTEAQQAISATVAHLEQLRDKSYVTDPTSALGAAFVSKNKTIATSTVQFTKQAQDLPKDTAQNIADAAKPARDADIQTEYSGAIITYDQPSTGDSGDLNGLVVAAIIIFFAFGSLVAMLLPIGTALFALAVGLSLINLVAAVHPVGTVAPILGMMIGLGVGIDYSLFIVTRYRQELGAGASVEDAVATATATAGQAVLFAGTTVVIAICGLWLSDIPYVGVLGFTTAIVVAVTVAAALSFLPALLGLVGRHVDAIGFHRDERPYDPDHPHGWGRWARFVARHPSWFVLVSLVILIALAMPVFSMQLGETDDGDLPKSATQRAAFDLIAEGFGAGANAPLLLAVELPKGAGTTELQAIADAASRTPGVATVAPPVTSPNGKAAQIVVIPSTAPDAEATTQLVARLRDNTLPPVEKSTDTNVYVGGVTATYIDLGDRIANRLPLFIFAVVALSFLVLMVAFHSLLVPLTAAAMNLLSVGAAYGVTVAVFQWGWGRSLVGIHDYVPIVSFVPMMMFAILFGLSMDYQVFLLTRVREAYDETGDNREAVIKGVATTARVISSAALIMISVFLSFISNPQAEVKMFGLGLAVAVFVDATIVRLLLVPALMTLLGKANWYLPRGLDRILPKITIE